MHEVLTYLPIFTALGATLASIWSIYGAFSALRARRRLSQRIVELARVDALLSELVRRSKAGEPISDEQLSRTRKLIESVARDQLSTRDQYFVELGLHQPNKADEKRFVKKILSPV